MTQRHHISIFSILVWFHIMISFTFSHYLTSPVNTTQMFYLPFNELISTDSLHPDKTNLKFRVSLENLPDLPDWISSVQTQNGDGFVYGSIPSKFFQMDLGNDVGLRADRVKSLPIRIVAINKASYNWTQQIVQLMVKEKRNKAKFEVEMWFSNLNVEDMFDSVRIANLTNITRNLWGKISEEIYVTLIESAIKMGGRMPTIPSDKHGVVVRLGSSVNFSSILFDLEQEVIPLRVRNPCPKEFRRTSAEKNFRDGDFIPNWCQFHLLDSSSVIEEENGPVHSPIHLTSDDFHPPKYDKEPQNLVPDFILSVIVPIVTSFLMLLVVAFFLCCYHEGIEKRNKDLSSIQMVQYASIHRASNNLRSLATKREGSKGPGITPTSTIQRSYGSSPSSTLPKQTIIPKICESKLYENSTTPKIGSVLVENNQYN